MKFKKLLVMSVMALTGTTTYASVPDGIWTMPEPEGLEFTTFTDDGTHYVLYNPVGKMFFASGNGWNTMASLRTFANEIWLEVSTETDAPEGSYELWNDNVNNSERSTGMLNMFTDDGNSTWVDHGTQGNYSWAYEIVGDGVRLQNVALIADKPEYTGMYLGFDGTYVTADNTENNANHRNAYTAILRHVDPSAAGVGVDWKAVTTDSYYAFTESEAYQTYTEGVKTYIASVGLKKTIETAEALSIDVAAALAAYTNTASTAADLAKAEASLADIIAAKSALKKTIEDYEAKGFTDNSAAKAVLNNTAATKAEVDQAKLDLDAAFVEWGKTAASVANPVDMTSKIVNPTFDNANLSGWSGDAFGRGGTVSDGAEHYSKNYDTYQKITGLTPGVYAVGVNGYYRSGNYGGTAEGHFVAGDAASKYAKLYAKVGENTYEVPIANVLSGAQAENQGAGDSEITYTDAEGNDVVAYVPNTMATGDYYFHTINQYANKLYVAVGEDGELTIGVKKTSMIDGDWSMFDDFSLTFYGSGADAAKLYLDETLKNYSDYTPEEGTIFTQSYLDAYKAAYSGEKTAADVAEAMAVIDGIGQSFKDLEKNIQLWKDWQELVDKVRSTYVVNDEYMSITPEIDDLADYVDEQEVIDILDAHEWTNEELQAEMDKVNEWVESLVEKSKLDVYDGKNMTSYIVNPTFETSTTKNSGTSQGWTVDRIDGGNVTPGPIDGAGDTFLEKCGYYNSCFESWHCHKWDVWQEIKNLPVGMYELEVQGYVRCEVNGYTKGDELGENFPSPVYLYMNSAMSQFPSVYSEIPAENGIDEFQIIENWTQEEINGNYFPNSMGGAAQCFYINKDQGREGMYKTTAYGLIAQPGDVFRIVVKMDADQDWWCIWDNFKLTYREPKADIVKPVLTDAIKTIDVSQPMGKTQLETAQKANDAANAALAGDDGQAMFDALVGVYDATDAVSSSVALFKTLQKSLEDLASAISMSNGAKETITAAEALYSQIADGIQAYSYENDDVEGLKTEIAKMITQLGLPADMASATDAAPVECTSAIVNYDYAEGNDNGWTGSAAINAEWMDAEKFNTNYDYYQVLQGMPAGVYQVELQGFYRAGFANEDYDAYQADPAANNNAFLYAVGENADTCAVPLMRLCTQTFLTETLEDGYAWASEASQMAVPNSMATGGNMFMTYNEATEKNYYEGNVVTVKVGEDGRLVIGLKKTTLIASDWTLWNAWKLTYFGKDSQLKPDGDASGISSAKVAAVDTEYFTVGGARVSKPGKGVTIVKQKLADGSVKVKKIIVK